MPIEKTWRSNKSTTTFANLLFGNDCGGLLMALSSHPTTYNDTVWRCINHQIRKSPCKTPYLYEELLIPIFHEIIMSVLNANPGIVRECVTAVKVVSSTPTAVKKNKIIDSVAAYDATETEKWLWRAVIQKVIVHQGHLLEFHIMDGTIQPYQMHRTSPRMCRLLKPTRDEIRQAYAQGESIAEIAQRFKVPQNAVRTAVPQAEHRRRSRKKEPPIAKRTAPNNRALCVLCLKFVYLCLVLIIASQNTPYADCEHKHQHRQLKF